jgi:PE-PPE domain
MCLSSGSVHNSNLETSEDPNASRTSSLLPQRRRVPSDDVHFVLVGDTAAPNGGLLERFDLPGEELTVPSFGITFGDPTPDDLYPTDTYTLEYNGFADFAQYPIDPLSDLNAFAGMIYEHLTYLDLERGRSKTRFPCRRRATRLPITT